MTTSAVSETTAQPRARSLLACHIDRARQYRLTGQLLSAPPIDDATLASLRSLLLNHTSRIGEDRSLRQLRAALENGWTSDIEQEFAALFAPQESSVDLRCDAPDSWVLALACRTVDKPPSDLRTTELATLAALADRTAWAIAAAEAPLLGSMLDIQRRLIAQHSDRCLGRLARSLEFSRGPFYGRVGLALRLRLEDDTRLLMPEDSHDDHAMQIAQQE
jgi:hypothetical protein